jgi:hypothetical protein
MGADMPNLKYYPGIHLEGLRKTYLLTSYFLSLISFTLNDNSFKGK